MINKARKYLFLATALSFFMSLEMQAQSKLELISLQTRALQAKQSGNVKLEDSLVQICINKFLFKDKKLDLFSKDNLTFMCQYLNNTEDKVFKLFLKYPEKVNAQLGKDKAQSMLRSAISKAYFNRTGLNSGANLDWTTLRKTLKSEFGEIGLETFYSKQMMHCLSMKDWENYGKYYKLYFEKALKRSEFDINNLTWSIFENVNDNKVLKFACDVVMKYAIQEWYQNDVFAYDTYANLLYKIGKRNLAIVWEEKAVKLSNGDKVFTTTLDKIQKGITTWRPQTNN